VCPSGGGCATLAVPRVQTYVVVVIPGGKKGGSRQAEVGTVCGHLEAEHVAVEPRGPLEVGDAQVHVADAHRRVQLWMARLVC
jgi:hypothetical protein